MIHKDLPADLGLDSSLMPSSPSLLHACWLPATLGMDTSLVPSTPSLPPARWLGQEPAALLLLFPPAEASCPETAACHVPAHMGHFEKCFSVLHPLTLLYFCLGTYKLYVLIFDFPLIEGKFYENSLF